jgi:hypothetical protein
VFVVSPIRTAQAGGTTGSRTVRESCACACAPASAQASKASRLKACPRP